MRVLRALIDLILPPRDTTARVRDVTTETLGRLVNPEYVSGLDSNTVALLPYRDALVRALIVEAKFHEDARAHTLLGAVLADYVREITDDGAFAAHTIHLIPIPLSRARFRERGYNQTELIAEHATRALRGDYVLDKRLLTRTRDTKPQTSLGRAARLRNMQGAFRVAGAVIPTDTYIIIDDVTTTGATLKAASIALRAAGAARVECIALAH